MLDQRGQALAGPLASGSGWTTASDSALTTGWSDGVLKILLASWISLGVMVTLALASLACCRAITTPELHLIHLDYVHSATIWYPHVVLEGVAHAVGSPLLVQLDEGIRAWGSSTTLQRLHSTSKMYMEYSKLKDSMGKQLPCFLFEPKKTMVQSDSWYLTCTDCNEKEYFICLVT